MSEYEKLHARISQLVARNDQFEKENRELREKLYRAENPPFNGRLDTWQAACGKARAETEALRDELKAVTIDAGRYRWIRSNQYDALEIIEHWSGEQMNYVTDDELDAAIDAELAK